MDQLEIQNSTDRPASFPFPPEPVSTSDPVLQTLVDALRATMANSPNAAIAALAENTLKAVHRIQHGAHLAEVSEFVAMRFRVRPEDLQSHSRQQKITFARMVAVYLCRKLSTSSYPTISGYFGGRHHATAIHSFKLISHRVQTDPAFRRTIERLERELAVYTAPVTTSVAA